MAGAFNTVHPGTGAVGTMPGRLMVTDNVYHFRNTADGDGYFLGPAIGLSGGEPGTLPAFAGQKQVANLGVVEVNGQLHTLFHFTVTGPAALVDGRPVSNIQPGVFDALFDPVTNSLVLFTAGDQVQFPFDSPNPDGGSSRQIVDSTVLPSGLFQAHVGQFNDGKGVGRLFGETFGMMRYAGRDALEFSPILDRFAFIPVFGEAARWTTAGCDNT